MVVAEEPRLYPGCTPRNPLQADTYHQRKRRDADFTPKCGRWPSQSLAPHPPPAPCPPHSLPPRGSSPGPARRVAHMAPRHGAGRPRRPPRRRPRLRRVLRRRRHDRTKRGSGAAATPRWQPSRRLASPTVAVAVRVAVEVEVKVTATPWARQGASRAPAAASQPAAARGQHTRVGTSPAQP